MLYDPFRLGEPLTEKDLFLNAAMVIDRDKGTGDKYVELHESNMSLNVKWFIKNNTAFDWQSH